MQQFVKRGGCTRSTCSKSPTNRGSGGSSARTTRSITLTESDFEAIFLAICMRYRLPLPEPQIRFGRRRADFTWPRYRIVVECQSRKWHDNEVKYQDDRAKQRALQAAGYIVLPFTWAEVVHTPAAVAAEIRAAMQRQERLVGLGPR